MLKGDLSFAVRRSITHSVPAGRATRVLINMERVYHVQGGGVAYTLRGSVSQVSAERVIRVLINIRPRR